VKRSTLPRYAPRLRRDLAAVRFLVFEDKIELPAQGVGELDDDELEALETKAVTAFDAIRNKENPSDEDVAEAERLAEIVTAVRTESQSRQESVASRRNRLAALGNDIDNGAGDEGDEEGEQAGSGEAGDTGEAGEVGGGQEDEEDEDPALVASGARRKGGARTQPREVSRVRAQDVSRRSARPLPPAHRTVSLTAAADVTDDHVLEYAADQRRLPQESLVAAGGWCAPSETLYDLVELEAADALIDVPEINVARGGIRFTPGPSFADIFAGTGFSQTEAEAIAGTTKPCYRVPCPPFTEIRAGVEGVCITSGILQDRAFPELTARVVRGALAAHAHKISAKTIAKIIAGSTVVPTLTAQGGAAAPVLNAIELGVEDVKYKHRIARATTLEAVFPAWLIPLIRADLAFRLGVEDYMSVTDAQIRQWFTDRRIVPQFVYDWQDSALGGATPATRWPATVDFLLYPAGTWVRGMGDVISLDSVYDSAGLVENEFTGLFTEESLLVAKLGHESRQYTVPVCADGTTAAGADIPCTAPA
jgi:hypothetical protein